MPATKVEVMLKVEAVATAEPATKKQRCDALLVIDQQMCVLSVWVVLFSYHTSIQRVIFSR